MDDLPPKIIACDTLRDEVGRVAGDLEVEYCEGQLHNYPERLRAELNERIAATPGARTILLALRALLQRHRRPGRRTPPSRAARG